MQVELTFTNYRCFSSRNPVHILMGGGFRAFLGVNNAGKSSLLRFFYELRPLFRDLCDTQKLEALCMGRDIAIEMVPEISDLEDLFFNGNEEDLRVELELTDLPSDSEKEVTKAIIVGNRKSKRWSCRFKTHEKEIVPDAVGNLNLGWKNLEFTSNGHHVAFFQFFVNTCLMLTKTCYIPAFRHIAAFAPTGGTNTYYDTSLGRPFIDMWHSMQSGDSRINRRKVHKLIEEIKDIFSFRELQINPSANKNTLQLIIDGQPFNLQELGAGITQFLLVMGNAAFKESSWILVDEPELSLHPSLQIKFLLTLAGYASRGVLFATHNIGLARSVAEELSSVITDVQGTRILNLQETPRLAELLGELNYEGYRPLGFDKILLVEGRTSFKVFLEFLRALTKDHQFLIVPMSDLITHNSKEELQEVTRISPRVFAVIDSERENATAGLPPTRQAFAQNCRDLGIECHVTQFRAIENYLSDRAVKAEMGPSYRALEPYEGRRGVNLWSKKDNWRIAKHMERAEIEATDLGQFLAAI